jgi:hypothetical protein
MLSSFAALFKTYTSETNPPHKAGMADTLG